MKGLGIFLLIIGVIGVGGGVALGMLPPELVLPDAAASCQSFVLTVLAGSAAEGLCLPTMFNLAWMVPTAILGSVVIALLGGLLLSGARARALKTTLAYTRTSKGIAPTSGRSLSGAGVPVASVGGITSNEQASYAARAGYSRTSSAPNPAAAVPASVAPAPAGYGQSTTQFVSPQPAAAQPASPAQPQFVTPQPQYATPQPQFSAQPAMAQPAMSQPSMVQPGMTQPSMTQPGMTQPGMTQPGMTQPSVGGFIEPGSGFAPAGATPVAAGAPGAFIQPGNGFVPQS